MFLDHDTEIMLDTKSLNPQFENASGCYVEKLIVIYKADGTTWCDRSAPIALEAHAAELRHIGVSAIIGQRSVPGPLPPSGIAGTASGQVNAFAIDQRDWQKIHQSMRSAFGFREWHGAPYPDLGIDTDCYSFTGAPARTSTVALPVLIRELVGRPCRCYRCGDGLSWDSVPERVNIELDEDNRITDIWFG